MPPLKPPLLCTDLSSCFIANAAALDKRNISASVALCISDITAIENQFTSLKTSVDGFTASSGYVGLLSIHSKAQTVQSQLLKAGTDCCAVPTVISTEENDAILTALTTLVPDVEGAMVSFVTKKPVFQSTLNGANAIKNDIIAMHTKHTPLNTCFSSVIPPISIPEQGNLLGQIEDAYNYAEREYSNSPATL
ncbi:hypothetical protein HMPREF1544_04475 [Mucor circinelloides 1006PhL]|uniref:Uncharacterized protein n=1 Tax=Mucor circinelloides f. circinelloides (strain 1006PhL) TaxID=1220926 RepID=S2JEI7_MUCC1|nr:hypothetical protein HMPREF1544_04475 [Mucor circinelloides 1006PhL]